jgi:hypothetical protein
VPHFCSSLLAPTTAKCGWAKKDCLMLAWDVVDMARLRMRARGGKRRIEDRRAPLPQALLRSLVVRRFCSIYFSVLKLA